MQRKAKELREKRASLVEQMKAIHALANTEKRELTTEELDQWDKLNVDTDVIKRQYEAIETQMARDAEIENQPPPPDTPEAADQATNEQRIEQQYSEAFGRALRSDSGKMDAEGLAIMEQRAMSAGTAASGGYLVPTAMAKKIDEALLAFGGVRSVATIQPTTSGEDMTFPTSNDTGNTGELLAENTEAASADPTIGSLTMKAYGWSSKQIPVSRKLLIDAAFNVEQFLTGAIATRIARAQNTYYTTGTGSDQPNGVVTAATASGYTTAVNAIGRENILDLIHSVDPAYRVGAHLMFNDSIALAIKKLTFSSGDDRPLWQAGIAVGAPDTIEGYPYVINQDMASIGASNKIMLFGDFKKYLIREVNGVTVMRLDERAAEKLQVIFLGYMYADGDLLDAGTNPIKSLACAAS